MARAPAGIAEVRAILYMLGMVVFGGLLAIFEFLVYPIVKLLDPTLFTYHRWTMTVSRWVMWPFGVRIAVKGREHIPRDKPVVIVVNHQSQLDINICSTGLHDVNFKCTFKRELLFYPGIGWALFMPGHVSVVRGDKDSGHAMMAACADYLRRGVSILFFAEGTRLLGGTEPVGPFKPGAFKLALDTGAAILPVSVSGARDLLPARGFPRMGYGEPVLTIHPPIDPPPREAVARMSPEEAKAAVGALAERTRGIIMQDMRPCDAVVLSAKEKAKVAAAEAAKEAAAAAAPAGPASKKVS